MTLKDYLHRIANQWILIVSVTVIFFAGGIAYASIPEEVPTQVYSSSSQVLLIDSQPAANSGVKSRIATVTAIDLIATDYVREQVATQSGITLKELTEKVELFGTATPDSTVLTLIASSEDSNLSILVANAAADVIVAESSQLLNADSELLETAREAIATIDLTRNTSLAKVAIPTVLGLLIGLFVAFVRAWTNNTVYSAQELLGLGTSHVISVGTRRNRGQSSSVIDEDDLRKVRSLLPEKSSPLLLVNESTDQDYSDFVSSLTMSFATLGDRVLVIDADLKSPSTLGVFTGIKAEKGIGPGISQPSEYSKLIHKVDESIEVLGSHGLIAHPEDVLGAKTFQKFIGLIQNKYDRIFFLSPSAAKGSIPSVLAGLAGAVVIVAETGVSELGNLSKTMTILNQSPVSSIAVVVLDSKVVTSKESTGR